MGFQYVFSPMYIDIMLNQKHTCKKQESKNYINYLLRLRGMKIEVNSKPDTEK